MLEYINREQKWQRLSTDAEPAKKPDGSAWEAGTKMTVMDTGVIRIYGSSGWYDFFTPGSGGGDALQATSLAIKAKTDNLPASPADETELESSSLIVGGGSLANNTRLGRLTRYIADNLGGGSVEYDGVYVDSVNGVALAQLTGSYTGAGSATVMVDSGASFTPSALIGSLIVNTTDHSQGIITANDATSVTVAALTGGSNNAWTTADAYAIHVYSAGIGTPQNPSSNLTDALTIAGVRKVNTIYIRDNTGLKLLSPVSPPVTFIGRSINNETADSIDPNGQDVTYSVFKDIAVWSAAAGTGIVFNGCDISGAQPHNSAYYDSFFEIGLFDGGLFKNCSFQHGSQFTFAFTGIEFWQANGKIEILNVAQGSASFFGSGLVITIDLATCSGGTINVYGDTKIIYLPGAGGVTVNDYTNKPQPEVPVNIAAILASETTVFDLSAADFHYTVDKLRLKSDDPGVGNDVIVRLYELENGISTLVDSFIINTANFATHFNLMDMFGVDYLAGDNLKVTVQQEVAGGPTAVVGSYAYRSA